MKRLSTLLLAVLVAGAAFGQTLTITYDATMSGAACQPLGAAKMYMHSGAGYTDATAAWETVIGNWGMDDGIGEMTNVGTDMWEIMIDPNAYYGISSDTTILSIGLVFRNADGTLEGKDAACTDIFIRGVDSATPTAENTDGTAFAGLTVQKTTGIDAPIAGLSNIEVFPAPATSYAVVTFDAEVQRAYTLTLTNTMGQVVRTQPVLGNRVVLERNSLPAGMYFATLADAEGNSATVRVLYR